MKEIATYSYEELTLDDLQTLSLYHNYICDGDNKKIIVIEKE